MTGAAIGAKLVYDGYQNLLAAIPGTQPGEVKRDSDSGKDPNAVDRPEVMAFLDTIAWAEGTGDSYDIQYTFARFSGFSDHPREIKCSGGLCSDAAGRYQFLSTTWDSQAKAANLPDFSPRSQDLGAIQLLKANGAYDKILKGDIEGAVNAVRSIWASFPGAGHNQPEKSMADVLRVYGEKLAARKAAASSAVASGKTVKFEGIQVTSAIDASGEPGLDYVVSNGQRGAEFGALVPGTVVKTQFEDWETHLENGEGKRGYGSYVIVRVEDGLGNDIDMLYAHMDRIDVKEGDRLEVGSVIGTQGRKGSTTGAHVSLDFFKAGTLTASAASIAMRDRIAQTLQNDVDSLNAKVRSSSAPAITPKVEIVSVGSSGTVDFAQSVVCVRAKINGKEPCASGVFVEPSKILTAYHVVQTWGGNPGNQGSISYNGLSIEGTIDRVDPKRDLALVNVSIQLPTIPIASTNPVAGQEVLAIGFPQSAGGKQVARTGAVSASATACGIPTQCFEVGGKVLEPGMSGGAVLSGGQIIGINRSIKESDPSLGYAVPASEIRAFMGGF